ncbi:MAG: four helix bundle protein [Planctomycetes bacterium]|nr:four helix bundle protein [Planctomycetota bacterium]
MVSDSQKPDIVGRTYRFAVAVAKFSDYHDVSYGAKGSMFKQLLKSGTSVGANVEEAQGGQSRADFLSKMSIAHKEAKETRYWLGVLMDSDIMAKGYEILVVNKSNGRDPIPHTQLTEPKRSMPHGYDGASAGYRYRMYADRYSWNTGVGVVDENLGLEAVRKQFVQHWRRVLDAYLRKNDYGRKWFDSKPFAEKWRCVKLTLLSDAYFLRKEADQICRILGAIVSSTRRNIKDSKSRKGSR